MAHPSERLRALGIELPPLPAPAGTYSPAVLEGEWGWVSGQVVSRGGVATPAGVVDSVVSVAEAQRTARTATLQAVGLLSAAAGGIDRIRRIVRVGVFVASTPSFHRQHEVANGATDVLVELWGEAGRPARASVGVVALPLNAPVEVELLARIG